MHEMSEHMLKTNGFRKRKPRVDGTWDLYKEVLSQRTGRTLRVTLTLSPHISDVARLTVESREAGRWAPIDAVREKDVHELAVRAVDIAYRLGR